MGQFVLSRTWNRDVSRVARRFACVFCVAVAGVAGVAKVAAAEPNRPTAAELGLEWGPETTVISEPRTADGYPDYVEFLNRRMSAGVPKEENFWAAMWGAVGNIERLPEPLLERVKRGLLSDIDSEPRMESLWTLVGVTGEAEAALSKAVGQAQAGSWRRADHPELQLWLDVNDEVLVRASEAARRPRGWMPVLGISDPRVTTRTVAHVAAARSVARLLKIRAMRCLGDGDHEGAWNDLMTAHRIAGHLEREDFLFDRLCGMEMRASLRKPLGHWLSRTSLAAEELERRRLEWASVIPVWSASATLETMRFEFLEKVLALKSGACSIEMFTGSRDHAATNQLVVDAVDLNEVLREGNRIFDALDAVLKLDHQATRLVGLREIVKPLEEVQQRIGDEGNLMPVFLQSLLEGQDRFLAQFLVRFDARSIEILEIQSVADAAKRALMKAAFLARIQMADSGAAAMTVNASYPLDPFSGAALRSQRTEKQFVLYSVGPDRQDDGAKEHEEGPGNDDIRIVLDLP